MESWNSTNRFNLYGKGAELATNRRENQEAGLLCLHLLQASLVYINTLMIQQVLRYVVVKTLFGFTYEDLAFHIVDSQNLRWFCRIGMAEEGFKNPP